MSIKANHMIISDQSSTDFTISDGTKSNQVQSKIFQSFSGRLVHWLKMIRSDNDDKKREGLMVVSKSAYGINKEMAYLAEIPFIIPRKLSDIQQQLKTPDYERIKLRIRRMDEYLVTLEDQDEAKRQRHYDTSIGLQALALAVNKIQKVSFREVLSVDEDSSNQARRISDANLPNDQTLRPVEKIDPITDFQEAHDFLEFDQELAKHRKSLVKKHTSKPSDMLYLKFCLIFELKRDPNENCLRILLHDIIFKFHLREFRLRCQIHVKKPTEHELSFEQIIDESHLKGSYSGEFVFYSGDWIVQQEVELSVVIKIESLSLTKYIGPKYWDIAHLHVKNVPHGASKIFLREMTPVHRPHKILSRGINVGQLEIEALYSSSQQQILIHIIKISHSQAERLLRAPETYVEIVFQNPFNIYDIQRTKVADRSLNPVFKEEFYFDIPEKTALSDVTIDLIFLEKSSLHQQPAVLGLLTLSKHTDWYPARKFWTELEENPNVKLKNSFLFEGNVDD